MRRFRLALAVVFVLVIWTPLIAAIASPRFVPFVRAVAASPAAFSAELEALRRSTPLWDRAVGGYNRLLYALGTTGNRAIAVAGRDGWLFLGDLFNANFSQATGRRRPDEAHLDRWAQLFSAEERWLHAQGIGYVVLVAPAKWSIRPDRLPAWAPRADADPFDRLLARHPVAAMPDLRPALREAERTAATFSPLNSHWTDFGAWAAWREWARVLEASAGDWGPLPVPAFGAAPVESGHNEFAGLLGLDLDNPWTRFEPATALAGYEVERDDGTRVAMAGSMQTHLLDLPRVTRNAAAPNPRTVLLLRDSSGNALSPFFQAAYARTVQVDHAIAAPDKTPDLRALVARHRPEQVVRVIAERYLAAQPPDAAALAERLPAPSAAP